MDLNINGIKIGVLGGGQLGKMLCQVTSRWNIQTYILDPAYDCPASSLCTNFYSGKLNDYDTVYKFGKMVDLLTIEIEHVNTDALIKLKEEGLEIRPDPKILKLIQNKGSQKQFYSENNLPTSPFRIADNSDQVKEMIDNGDVDFPFVQKLCTLGYDGKGVKVIRSIDDLSGFMDGESVIEQFVDIRKEISVIVSQNKLGEIKCYPPVEMLFNSNANLVEYLICPTDIDPKLAQKACDLAKDTIKAFGLYGILAVEMFIDQNDDLLINEVAPRPHNSGHHTIEASVTSQYEQCLRSILDLPLGNTEIMSPSVMVNILGEPGFNGNVIYQGLEECMGIDGANFHIYGKTDTKPYRKMGHVTILDSDLNSALDKAKYIKSKLKVIA